MRTETATAIKLSDYRPPSWLIDTVHLDVSLHPTQTRVRATLEVRPNAQTPAPLVLDGEDVSLVSIALDGAPLPPEAYHVATHGLTLAQPPQRPFRLEIETRIDPTANLQLSGLYRSSGNYCTQCEAEGFRRITFFPDRPDVMAIYTTRIEADHAEAPVLLANGNLIESGNLPEGRHFATWHDPFRKPSYLFAMVGGTLACVGDTFTTMSGRTVALKIYVEPGKEDRCAYAMDSLKRAMRWDEEAFGREYDLDIFMIVAVSDFNMGAMENKGLNVFNDKLVLASPQTATDADYASIEAVIAHEYFHNWTGNRITCRDWFQLCLKEGFTVFRDQEFTSDQRSRAVKRISDVRLLRTTQFVEDAGPLSHPVRPQAYKEINNFYTTTIYEKGAELVRMVKTLIGPQAFRAGTDLYFERHDGEAATVEQFIRCFADVSGRDMSQFMRWYSQAGTPEVIASGTYDRKSKTYKLGVAQSNAPMPGHSVKEPVVIPLAFGLVGADGNDMALTLNDGGRIDNGVLVLERSSQEWIFIGIDTRPVLSINRGFSAPIKLGVNLSTEDLAFLAAHDRDPFNRWNSVQGLGTRAMMQHAAGLRAGGDMRPEAGLTDALAHILADTTLEPAFVAQCLISPSETDLARDIGRNVDPGRINEARVSLRKIIGSKLGKALRAAYDTNHVSGEYSPDAVSAGRRSLRNASLDLLVAGDDAAAVTLAALQYREADNMTDRMAALSALAQRDTSEREDALRDFETRYAGNPLIMDKWFALQAMMPEDGTLDRIRGLMTHAAFAMTNPNRVRALIGAFAHSNPREFNRPDGAGYAFVADRVLELDPVNPQVASRLATAFRSWKMLEPVRRGLAEAALRRILSTPSLSRDVSDIAERALAG